MEDTFESGDMVYGDEYFGIVIEVRDGKSLSVKLSNFWIKVWWNYGNISEYPSDLLRSRYRLIKGR